jgi:hypothetical protein
MHPIHIDHIEVDDRARRCDQSNSEAHGAGQHQNQFGDAISIRRRNDNRPGHGSRPPLGDHVGKAIQRWHQLRLGGSSQNSVRRLCYVLARDRQRRPIGQRRSNPSSGDRLRSLLPEQAHRLPHPFSATGKAQESMPDHSVVNEDVDRRPIGDSIPSRPRSFVLYQEVDLIPVVLDGQEIGRAAVAELLP